MFYRVFCVVTIAAWNGVGLYSLSHDRSPAPMLWLLPVLVPALFLSFSLGAFRFPFSAFGRYVRTPLPTSQPLVIDRRSSGIVGHMSATVPFVSWFLFAEGIGFSVLGVGDGFIPLHLIRRTADRTFYGFTVWHDSPEVRSPVVLPSKRLRAALLAQLAARPGAPPLPHNAA